MTDFPTTPPGWYHAQGDADGTHRYWDGVQWVGDPQPARAQESTGFVTRSAPQHQAAPSYPAGQTPSYPAPGGFGPGQAGSPVGYVPFAYGAPSAVAQMQPAPIGRRLKAYVIDIAPLVVGFLVIIGGVAVLGEGSLPVTIVVALACGVYCIWNFWVRRGGTGQSIGDTNQGIKLVKDATGQPVGGWIAFARYFVMGLLSNFSCGIIGFLDILWPLWDDRNQRLGDKMFSMTVVVA